MGGTYFDVRCIFSREGHPFLIALAVILWLKIFFWRGGGVLGTSVLTHSVKCTLSRGVFLTLFAPRGVPHYDSESEH